MTQHLSTTIDLIRHGEPVGGKKYRGHIDDPLSDKGWQQMRSAVADHKPWSAVVSSSLSRCSEFAHEVAKRHQLPITLDNRLMELSFGDWEGKTASELLQDDPERLNRFWSDPINNTPPNAETLVEFKTRILNGWQAAITTHKGKHILMVGHAGMMRMIISMALGMPIDNMFRIQVPNAGITRITIDHHHESDLPRLIFHSGHL